MVWRIASVGSLLQDYAGVTGDVCMGETFLNTWSLIQQFETAVGKFLQICFLEFPEVGVADCQVGHPWTLRYWTKMPRLRTAESRVMICVNGQGISWVLNLVGPVMRIDRSDDNRPRTCHCDLGRCIRWWKWACLESSVWIVSAVLSNRMDMSDAC